MEHVRYAELEDGELASTYEYTLYEPWQPKTWEEAAAACQSEGGHLASILSEEVSEALETLADRNTVWVGLARKESGEWSWSDNSTYHYSNWKQDPSRKKREFAVIEEEDDEEMDHSKTGNCVDVYLGKWYNEPCTKQYKFICQVERIPLRGKKTMNLTYMKDQVSFSSFHVWYK